MIVCVQCGYANPDSNKFCQNCGKVLEKASATPVVSDSIASSESPEPVEPVVNPETDNEPIAPELALFDIEQIDSQPEPPSELASADSTATSVPSEAPSTTPSTLEAATSVPSEAPSTTSSTLEDEIALVTDTEAALPDFNLTEANSASPTTELQISSDSIPTVPIIKANNAPTLRLSSLNYAGLTDVGKQRDHNEDSFAIVRQVTSTVNPSQGHKDAYRGLFVLCDGMGGHAGGEVASNIAVNNIKENFQPFWLSTLPGEQTLQEIIGKANEAIYCLNEQELRREAGRMGTTLVLLALYNTEVAIAHVGDSRIYKVTATELQQITRDHEVANRLIDRGVDAEVALARPDAHQLTQALGPNSNQQIQPAIQYLEITEPTLFLLCSDGLCDNDVVEQNWQTHLLPLLSAEADLQAGIKALIELGNDLNGHDNITAILVNCQIESTNL